MVKKFKGALIMDIAFFGTKPYDRLWFEPLSKEYGCNIHFIESGISEDTVILASGSNAVCVFVNDYITENIAKKLSDMGIKLILLRCAGFNNIDLKAVKEFGITVLRVPSYSPAAVAEFSMAAILTVNRQTHRAYSRTRDFNMSINGLMGRDLTGKTAGVIGTGKIGQCMIDIFNGFHMKVLAYDLYPNENLDAVYVSLDELFEKSDVISLHCPLTKDTRHIINKDSIDKMKPGVILSNTSRGALIDSQALVDALKSGKIGAVALDVYEEEDGVFYEDVSNEIVQDDTLSRLCTLPNVLITSHMGFFTKEAMQAIAIETLENALAYENGTKLINIVQ